jgi:hypothetical protein
MYGTQQRGLIDLLNLQERGVQDRAQMGLQAPGQRMRQSVLGSLIQNMQAAKVTPPPGVNMAQMSGGLSPALLSPAVRAGGGELQRQALLALLNKSDVPGPTDYPTSGMIAPPAYKGAGKGETLASLLGIGANIAGSYAGGR